MLTTPKTGQNIISTANAEIDKKMGGGIPVGSLTLVEGQSDAGKSVLCQHMIFGGLGDGHRVAYYTTENTPRSLLRQMDSLAMPVTDYFLMDWLRIYPMKMSARSVDTDQVFSGLLKHMEHLPQAFEAVMIDSMTTLVTHSQERAVIDFFTDCKEMCDEGRTIFLVVHSYGFSESMLIRVRSLCDAHLRLRLEEVGDRLVKMLEVSKVRNAERTTGSIVSFDVEPDVGMRIIPISKAKA